MKTFNELIVKRIDKTGEDKGFYFLFNILVMLEDELRGWMRKVY